MNEYKIFHATRIMNVLLGQQTPNNDHGQNGISSGGNFKGNVLTIITSLFESGMINYEEHEAVIKALYNARKTAEEKARCKANNKVNIGVYFTGLR